MNKFCLTPIFLLALGAAAQTPMMPKPASDPSAFSQALAQPLTIVEKQFISAAEAMPEEKYAYVPTQGEFKDVRTFGQQVKHVAVANYALAAFILGEKPPVDVSNMNGPDTIKTKADILKFITDSYAYVHKALATITEQNASTPEKSPFGNGTATKLGMATLAVAHSLDHYGQMAVYLRLNGIVPPSQPEDA